MYTAIFLNKATKRFLLKKFNVPDGWKFYGDHMTIKMGKVPDNLKSQLGKEFVLTINSVGVSKTNVALGVDSKLSKNKQPHITFAVDIKNGGKPKDSNDIVKWKKLKPFEVIGILEER